NISRVQIGAGGRRPKPLSSNPLTSPFYHRVLYFTALTGLRAPDDHRDAVGLVSRHGYNRTARYRTGRGVGGRDGLAPRRPQNNREGVRTRIPARERVVGRQGGLVVRAREMDLATVAGRHVAVRIQSGDGNGECRPHGGAGGSRDAKLGGRRG